MKQLGLYCILLIGLYSPSNAQKPDAPPEKKQVYAAAERDACNLLPPTQFHSTFVGTDWVKLRWLPAPGAWGYEIKAYQLPAGLLDTQIVTQATDLEIKGLRPGASYRFTIASVCDNLFSSPFVDGEILNLIILELVVNAQSKPPVCPVNINSDAFCMLQPWNLTESGSNYWLQVGNSSTCRVFRFQTLSNSTIKIFPNSLGNCNNQEYAISEDDYTATISHNGITIAELAFSEIGSAGAQLEICADALTLGYSFAYLKNQCSLTPGASFETRSDDWVTHGFTCSILENPVQGEIRCRYDAEQSTIISAQLLSLDGKMILSETIPLAAGANQVFALNTNGQTNGIYLLYLHAGAGRHVYKVILNGN